jgi:hypothetical protein
MVQFGIFLEQIDPAINLNREYNYSFTGHVCTMLYDIGSHYHVKIQLRINMTNLFKG